VSVTEKYGFIDVEKVTATDAGEKKYSCARTDPGEHNVGLVVPAPGDAGDRSDHPARRHGRHRAGTLGTRLSRDALVVGVFR
jgi:hypothetical protein